MQVKEFLSKHDLVLLMELIHKSLACTSEEGLRELVADLKQLIPHDFALCLMGSRTSNDGLCGALDIINVSYPSEWLESYFSRRYCMVDPVIKENFTKFSIQFLADTYKNAPKDFIMLAEDFGLTEGYTHGMRDGRGIRGSLFSFAGSSVERHLRNEVILGYIIPHLHLALARILARPGNKNRSPLSMREKEVVRWLKAGKSAWDISLILGISERTVRFHINNIMQKLDAVNRTHAVAIALEQGLIDFE